MILTRSIIAGCLMLGGIAAAGVPERRPLQSYQHLWQPGFMTAERKTIEQPPVNPLADWQLTGVSELEDGYFVTLSHRKNTGEQKVVRSSSGGTGFTVERVEFADDWRKLVVHLNCGGVPASIRFDERPPVPAAAARTNEAAKQTQPHPGRPRGLQSPSSPVSAPAR